MAALDGRVVLITGGGRGIGRAIAHRLSREGATIMVADVNGENAERVAQEIQQAGGKSAWQQVDLTQRGAPHACVERTVLELGSLDVLFNNAGIAQVRKLLEITEEDWRRMFAVNVDALFFCLQAAARHMLAQGHGKIINTASIAGRLGRGPMAHYAATKAAVISITRSAADALAPTVTVNAMCPGIVDTDMWKQIDAEFAEQEGWAIGEAFTRRIAGIPLGRKEEPEDVAALAAFLAGPDSDYITGQAINVCGGMVMS